MTQPRSATEAGAAVAGAAVAGATEALDGGSPIRVLIAEDETHLGAILEQFLSARGFAVRVVRDGRAALEALQHDLFDVALLDVVMPEVDGLEVLRQVRERPAPPEIIVITGNGTIETAMAALKLGAYDFLSKPYRMAEIEALVRRAWEKRLLVRDHRYRQAVHRREEPDAPTTGFAPLRAVFDMVEQFARSPLPVLITGEAGTGRRQLARHLHRGRLGGAFVSFDCQHTVAVQHMEALFGGAAAEPAASPAGDLALGALELASRGTLYLQHVEALAAPAQERLLAALETGVFDARGDGRRVPLTVRIVASSTRDLGALAASGRFDEQLLHRLSAMRIHLPPLRERGSDAVLLARQFLAEAGVAAPLAFAPGALDAVERYDWPGNVRELRLAVERAAYLAADGLVTAEALGVCQPVPADDTEGGRAMPDEAMGRRAEASPGSLADLERRHIASVLDRTAWHQGRAAEILGISPKTLYRKIREFGFKRPSGRTS